MRKIKVLALALAVLMLIPIIVSCKGPDEGSSNTSPGTVETHDDRLPLSVAAEDNKGKDIKILLPTHDTLDYANEAGGTVVSQAVFGVDAQVKAHLGINMSYTQLDGNWATRATFNNRLLAMAMDSTAEFDLIMAETSASYGYALKNGLVLDLTTVEVLETDKPWYLSDMLNTYGINGKLFGIRSDASLTDYSGMGAVFFNEEILDNHGLDNIYDLVEANKWTAEVMFGMAKKVGGAADGGVGNLASDTFGYVGHCVASRGFMTAFNANVTERSTKDGNIYMKEAAGESFIEMYDYLSSVFENNVSNMVVTVSADSDAGRGVFEAGRSLFYHGFLSTGEFFRDSDFDWGLAPVPMYNEEQGRYYTPAGASAMMIMIMKNAADVELVGKVIEVKSYYSHYEAVPAYYEQTLGLQYANSPRQMDMLEIIRDTSVLTYLAAMCSNITPDPYNMYQMDTYWRDDKVQGSISTYYSGNVTSWNSQFESLYKSLS
ncbi:MAG: carbohydrate ABC transporter substrate-binding protein [Clostridia bacterium]|nr:carbohydrate ABC transporter substrate-binding protein [Clostridia bacterium]